MATLKIITDDDLANKGVIPLADVPGLPAEEMKQKFEEIVRDVVITAFNQNMALLENAVFVDPESHTYYLKQSDLLTSKQAILDNSDAGKVAGAVAVKEVNNYLDGIFNTLSLDVSALNLTVGQHSTTLVQISSQILALNAQGFITFEKNDTSGDKITKKCEFNYTANTAKIPTTAPTYTRAGYTFLGWSDDGNAVTADWQTGDTITNLDQHTYGNFVQLFAVWQENTP